MLRKIAIGALLASLMLISVACSSPTSTLAPPLPPTPAPAPTQAPPATPTDFQFAELEIDPAEANPGEKIIVTAKITNPRATEDSYTARLIINDTTEAMIKVDLPAGETQTLSFSVSRDIPGPYQVTIGELTGQFVVVKPIELTSTSNTETTTPELIKAPDFTCTDVVTNETISLAQFEGSVILLNFVNYGCSSRLNQIVSAQLLVIRDLAKCRDDFVPVSIFCGCCPADGLRNFAKQNELTWPWVLDTADSIVPQYADYLIECGYPTLIFIDKEQTIRGATSYCDFFTLDEKIDEILEY